MTILLMWEWKRRDEQNEWMKEKSIREDLWLCVCMCVCVCKDLSQCVPACLILSQQRSPAQLDASPIPPSTGTEQGNTWLAVTTASHKTHTQTPTHTPFLPFVPFIAIKYSDSPLKRMKAKNTSSWSYRWNICSFRECIHPRHLTLLPPSPFPLYLGRLVEFFLLWSAVQLVENHSIWALSWYRRLAVSCGAATAALGRFQLGEQTPAGRRENETQKDYMCNIVISTMCCCALPPPLSRYQSFQALL